MGNFGQMLARAIKQAARALKQSALRASTALVSCVEMVYEGGSWVAKTVLRAMPTFGGGGGGSAADPAMEAEAAMDRLIERSEPKSDAAPYDPESMTLRDQAKYLQMLCKARLAGRGVGEERLAKLPSGLRQLYGALTDQQASTISSMPRDQVNLWLRGDQGIGLPSPADVVSPPRPVFNREQLERNMAAIAEQKASNVVAFAQRRAA